MKLIGFLILIDRIKKDNKSNNKAIKKVKARV
jgi:hypothetical protein